MLTKEHKKIVAIIDDEPFVLEALQGDFKWRGKEEGKDFLLVNGKNVEQAISDLNPVWSNIAFLAIDSLGGIYIYGQTA